MMDCRPDIELFKYLLIGLLGFFMGFNTGPKLAEIKSEKMGNQMESKLFKFQTVLDDRARLSKELNIAVRDHSITKCSINDKTSETGGWCSTYFNTSHATDENFAEALTEMFENKIIGSFGDGPGMYKKILLKSGRIKVYDAYDGAPNIEKATNNEVKFLDLSITHFGLPVYDWVFSIEVAEHIPKQYEKIYLSNLIRHAREGLLMSWAVPGQGGAEHINEKPHEYVINLFSPCFVLNVEKSEILRNRSTFSWLRNNMMVFERDSKCLLDEHES